MELLFESPARFAPRTFASARGRLPWSISRLLTRMTTQSGAIFDRSSMTNCGICRALSAAHRIVLPGGQEHEEVATALGLPRGTVLSQLARARERLRVRLSHRDLADFGRGFREPARAHGLVRRSGPRPFARTGNANATVRRGGRLRAGPASGPASPEGHAHAPGYGRSDRSPPRRYWPPGWASRAIALSACRP